MEKPIIGFSTTDMLFVVLRRDLTFSSLDLNEQKDYMFLSRIYLECDSGSGTQEILRFGSGSKLIITGKDLYLIQYIIFVYLTIFNEWNETILDDAYMFCYTQMQWLRIGQNNFIFLEINKCYVVQTLYIREV